MYHTAIRVLQAPEHLCYFETASCLFSTLSQLYQKFLDDACAAPHVLDAITAIDDKLDVRMLALDVCVCEHACVRACACARVCVCL